MLERMKLKDCGIDFLWDCHLMPPKEDHVGTNAMIWKCSCDLVKEVLECQICGGNSICIKSSLLRFV